MKNEMEKDIYEIDYVIIDQLTPKYIHRHGVEGKRKLKHKEEIITPNAVKREYVERERKRAEQTNNGYEREKKKKKNLENEKQTHKKGP